LVELIFELGWNWNKGVKHIVKTGSCQAPHTICNIWWNES